MNIKINKKGSFNFMLEWAEFFFFIVFVIGFILSFLSRNSIVVYVISALSGLFFGRFLYQKKTKFPVPVYMIVFGYVLGFILGMMFTHVGSWVVAIAVFIIFNMISYFVHEKGFIFD